MKLFKLSQTENSAYDTYDSAIVAADTEEEAHNTHPSSCSINWNIYWEDTYKDWAMTPEGIRVEYIGEAKPGIKPGVICASFNAG